MPRAPRNPARTKAEKRPTWTSLTVETLRVMDDLLTLPQLCDLTGGTPNQISAALCMLQKYEAVEAIEGNGKLWFFLTGRDTRSHTLAERTPEEPGTRNTKGRAARRTPNLQPTPPKGESHHD